MHLTQQLTDDVILHELGQRLAHTRLNRNITQAQLAQEAGVSKRTVERLEAGEVAIQFSGLVRVLRALNMLDRMEALIPEPTPSPMAMLKLREKTRHRARRSGTPGTPEKWTWNDKPS